MLLATEADLRMLHAYVSVLQGRLALARVSGNRREFDAVADSQFAQVRALCEAATNGIDAVLDRVAPELATTAAAVADLNCQREFDLPPSARQLRLVAVEADLPA